MNYYNQNYGVFRATSETLYEPSMWDYITGMDWGKDRCLQNGIEAYICYSSMLTRAVLIFGWDQKAVNTLIEKAYGYRNGTAKDFWGNVQKNFMKWVKETGWHISDFPKWKDVLKQMDLYTDSAFSFQELQDDADRIFQNTALATGGDLWEMWQTNIPQPLRIVAYVIAGGAVLAYTYPLLSLAFKAVGALKPKKSKE